MNCSSYNPYNTDNIHVVMFQGLILHYFEGEDAGEKANASREKFLQENPHEYKYGELILSVRPDLVVVIRD